VKGLILKHAPILVQNLAISAFNRHQWWKRQGGDYRNWFSLCESALGWDEATWTSYQQRQLEEFLAYAAHNSKHYSNIDVKYGLQGFPILEKETLINNYNDIRTISERDGIVSYTGGTTGASMKVIYSLSDVQKRFATLDWFRSLSGWKLGKRTAWFSGKTIVRESDIVSGNCYRDDWLTETRFFSTFHINEENFDIYWRALIEFNPEFIVGFPSSLSDLLTIAQHRGLKYPHTVKAVFPTAETVLTRHVELFKTVLGASTMNQYASSEGAPFIVQCLSGSLHALPYTGIFEVVDELGQPARVGEILVTSFQTRGTPLIRYRIGDRVALAPEGTVCKCGCSFPIIQRIEGRDADFVWSPEYGRINLGNLSNSTKGVPGIIAFRVLQSEPFSITVEVQSTQDFNDAAAKKFEMELRKRTGDKMTIRLVRCAEIPRKQSGKFRIVENSLLPEQLVRSEQ